MHRFFHPLLLREFGRFCRYMTLGLLIAFTIMALTLMTLANFAPQEAVPLLLRTSELLIG